MRNRIISLGVIGVLAACSASAVAVAEPKQIKVDQTMSAYPVKSHNLTDEQVYEALHDFEVFKRLPIDVQQEICESDAQCEWAYGIPITAAMDGTLLPRLVGKNCAGAGGFIYAYEEDHFPAPCEAIEAIYFGD